MKRVIALGFAALCVVPAAAQAQEVTGWHLSTPNNDKECYAFTTGNVAFGFQAPNADRVGALVLMAPASAGAPAGDTVFTFDVPGPLRGDHATKTDADTKMIMAFFRLESFDDLDAFPDRWHFGATKGGQKIADVNVTNFRAALTAVRKCVADR